MATLVLGDPPQIKAMIAERERTGIARRDEVWEGVLHMVPAASHGHGLVTAQIVALLSPLASSAGLSITGEVNVGKGVDDFRIPDAALHRPGAEPMWHPTAALVVEVVSPDDQSWEKLPFYAAHDVDEVLIVDPEKRSVDWLGLHDGKYRPLEVSGLIDLSPITLGRQLWP